MDKKLYQQSRQIVAPVLVAYVEWILKNATEQGISTLYFQARDGYPLMKIAEKLVRHHDYAIHCRYLYCSRAALRLPTFHLIGDEAFDLLFLNGPHVTLDTLFHRAGVAGTLKEQLARELNLEEQEMKKVLPNEEIERYKGFFRKNKAFCDHIMSTSREAYRSAIAYFKQEQLFDQVCIGLVDSGWAGTMQRSLRQLLTSAGYRGRIVGFYFGMFSPPKSSEDGEYLPWYFSWNRQLRNKVCFNSHLFECMLSAPHGMTLSYTEKGDAYVPVLAPAPAGKMLESIQTQLRGLLDGTDDFLTSGVPNNALVRSAKKQFRRLMTAPCPNEVEAYGDFLFDHDISETDQRPLAEKIQPEEAREFFFLRRILNIRKRRQAPRSREVFWIYGSLAYMEPPIFRWWLRINIESYEILRYLIKKH